MVATQSRRRQVVYYEPRWHNLLPYVVIGLLVAGGLAYLFHSVGLFSKEAVSFKEVWEGGSGVVDSPQVEEAEEAGGGGSKFHPVLVFFFVYLLITAYLWFALLFGHFSAGLMDGEGFRGALRSTHRELVAPLNPRLYDFQFSLRRGYFRARVRPPRNPDLDESTGVTVDRFRHPLRRVFNENERGDFWNTLAEQNYKVLTSVSRKMRRGKRKPALRELVDRYKDPAFVTRLYTGLQTATGDPNTYHTEGTGKHCVLAECLCQYSFSALWAKHAMGGDYDYAGLGSETFADVIRKATQTRRGMSSAEQMLLVMTSLSAMKEIRDDLVIEAEDGGPGVTIEEFFALPPDAELDRMTKMLYNAVKGGRGENMVVVGLSADGHITCEF